jgi:hypothetical protein
MVLQKSAFNMFWRFLFAFDVVQITYRAEEARTQSKPGYNGWKAKSFSFFFSAM